MNIIIADPAAKVRSALRLLIEQEFSPAAITECHNAAALAQTLNAADADLLLLDRALPGLDPAFDLDTLARIYPTLQIVLLTSAGECPPPLMTGVTAAICKNQCPHHVMDTLHAVWRFDYGLAPAR